MTETKSANVSLYLRPNQIVIGNKIIEKNFIKTTDISTHDCKNLPIFISLKK